MQLMIVAFVWVLNFAISWNNARVVGQTIERRRHLRRHGWNLGIELGRFESEASFRERCRRAVHGRFHVEPPGRCSCRGERP